MLPPQPAQAAAEGVADDAYVGARAGQRGEPVLRGRLDDLEPEDTRFDPRLLLLGVDLDAAHSRGLEQDRVAEVPERRRVVAGALGRHAEAVLAREPSRLNDVVDRLGVHDGRRPLVDGEVPGPARLVPARVDRGGDLAVEPRAKGEDVEARRFLH